MIYPPDFEAFWSVWRETARPRDPKKLAFKAWSARIREGTEPELLLGCAREYAAELRRKGTAGTEYVMMGSTFLGPNERWAEYEPKPPAPGSRPGTVRGAESGSGKTETAAGNQSSQEERIDARPFLRELIEKLAGAKKSPTADYMRGRK